MSESIPLLSTDGELKLKSAAYLLEKTYTKHFAVDHANQVFIDLSSTRKHKIIRALYLGDLVIRRMWETEGCLEWEVLSSHYFKDLEYQKLFDLPPVREYTQKYLVRYNPWKDSIERWRCDCQFFSLYAGFENCTHIYTIRLFNILKDYLPYFIYAYRFLLPNHCYKQFMIDFGHKPL